MKSVKVAFRYWALPSSKMSKMFFEEILKKGLRRRFEGCILKATACICDSKHIFRSYMQGANTTISQSNQIRAGLAKGQ